MNFNKTPLRFHYVIKKGKKKQLYKIKKIMKIVAINYLCDSSLRLATC